MDKAMIRRATKEDKNAVLDLRDNVLDSLDYLPEYYDHLMTSPNVFPVVMVHDGKIIAFEAAHVVNNGCTVVTRAGRVHPDFEGLGLVKDLSNFIIHRAVAKGAKSAVSVIGDLTSPAHRVPESSSPKRILTLTSEHTAANIAVVAEKKDLPSKTIFDKRPPLRSFLGDLSTQV